MDDLNLHPKNDDSNHPKMDDFKYHPKNDDSNHPKMDEYKPSCHYIGKGHS